MSVSRLVFRALYEIRLYRVLIIAFLSTSYNRTIVDFCFGEPEILLNSKLFILTSASSRSILNLLCNSTGAAS